MQNLVVGVRKHPRLVNRRLQRHLQEPLEVDEEELGETRRLDSADVDVHNGGAGKGAAEQGSNRRSSAPRCGCILALFLWVAPAAAIQLCLLPRHHLTSGDCVHVICTGLARGGRRMLC